MSSIVGLDIDDGLHVSARTEDERDGGDLGRGSLPEDRQISSLQRQPPIFARIDPGRCRVRLRASPRTSHTPELFIDADDVVFAEPLGRGTGGALRRVDRGEAGLAGHRARSGTPPRRTRSRLNMLILGIPARSTRYSARPSVHQWTCCGVNRSRPRVQRTDLGDLGDLEGMHQLVPEGVTELVRNRRGTGARLRRFRYSVKPSTPSGMMPGKMLVCSKCGVTRRR